MVIKVNNKEISVGIETVNMAKTHKIEPYGVSYQVTTRVYPLRPLSDYEREKVCQEIENRIRNF